jgi:2-polyprenyl-6-methoxyphenol hydroxylase-like FAD-dependent oxidoreductase
MKAVIIGAGIGGLTCAIAMRLIGWEVAVYERARELREVGAGISIWANALRSLDHLGAGDAVRAVAHPMTRAEFRRANGKLMIGYDTGELERLLKQPTTVTMTHRAELIAALASRLPADIVHCGHELVRARETDGRARAEFKNGAVQSADLLIGADGIHSAVRDAIFGDNDTSPRYSGYTAWRGVCTAGPDLVPRGYGAEIWGRGARFGITSLPDDPGGSGPRVYWWATYNTPPGGHQPDEKAHLLTIFDHARWARPVPHLIEATPASAIIRGDIIDRPPTRPWSKGPLVLIGDAAHPTTPNLGQGGCMAIEDAPVLARCINQSPSFTEALARFENERFTRTSAVTAKSRQLGWLGQRSNPLVCATRDFCFGLTSSRVAFNMLLQWTTHDTGGVGAPR